MEQKTLTDSELMLLGLIAEMPRHAYELEQIIEYRDMREWSNIGFSSIYFILNKLEKMGLVTAKKPDAIKAKKTYKMTKTGVKTLSSQTIIFLKTYRPTYSSLLLGMLHWPNLDRIDALNALEARNQAITAEIARITNIQFDQQPLPDFVDLLFDFTHSQLKAEAEWIENTLSYMMDKPWL